MALRFMDSFDHYEITDWLQKYTAQTGSISVNNPNGRRSTSSYRLVGTSIGRIEKTLDSQATWIMGFAYRLTALPTSSHCAIARWVDNATTQMELGINTSGQLVLWLGGSTVIGTASMPLVASASLYQYIEWLVTFHGSAGVATVRLNEQAVLTLSGIATIASANASADRFRIGNIGDANPGAGTMDIEDLYVCDGTGSAPNNTFLGDCRVDCLRPNGDGSNSAWTVSTGTTHYTLVDDTTPNTSDYLSTSTAGARESHALVNYPTVTSPTIYGIQHCISAIKDDAGVRQIKNLLKSGSTTVVGATTHTLVDTAYFYYNQIWETDPDTAAAWTAAAITALEAGMENQ